MPEATVEMQEYLESYVPTIVERFLTEKPVPQMEGTSFTTQVTIEGEKSLKFGIEIKDAREITMHPEGIDDAMISIVIPEDVIRPLTRQISQLTGRKQYDEVKRAKGTLTLELEMPGDWVLPFKITFNGAEEPKGTLRGPVETMLKVMTGEIAGPTAFMEGKIKIEGDMMFLMSLSSLVL